MADSRGVVKTKAIPFGPLISEDEDWSFFGDFSDEIVDFGPDICPVAAVNTRQVLLGLPNLAHNRTVDLDIQVTGPKMLA